MIKKILYIIAFISFSFNLTANEEDLSKYYKVDKIKQDITCFQPTFIKELNEVYIKNKEDFNVYKVKMDTVNSHCSWHEDRIVFVKDTPSSIITEVTENSKNLLHSTVSFKVNFAVERLLRGHNIDIKSLEIPFFVALYNTETDEILQQKDYFINISFNESKNLFKSENIKLEFSLPLEAYNNYEILTGIYVE